MLSVSAEYPNPGSTAFLIGSAEEVRIIQHRPDGRALVAIADRWKTASSTRSVAFADLAPTREAATLPPRGNRARASRALGA